MNQFAKFITLILIFTCNYCLVFAQNWDIPTIEWYNEIRIRIADKTMNEQIELMEIIQSKNLFTFYKNQQNFKDSDTNFSNSLSKGELTQNFKNEEKFLAEYWQKQLNKLSKTYKPEQLKDIEYLKRNVGLLRQLIQNSLWLRRNNTIIEQIFQDTDWVKKHKIIVRALSENIHYFVSNPKKALQWYKNPAMKAGDKNFMLLRQLHIRHLSTNQQIKKTL